MKSRAPGGGDHLGHADDCDDEPCRSRTRASSAVEELIPLAISKVRRVAQGPLHSVSEIGLIPVLG